MAIVCFSGLKDVVDFFLDFVMAAIDYLLGLKMGVVGFGWEKILGEKRLEFLEIGDELCRNQSGIGLENPLLKVANSR